MRRIGLLLPLILLSSAFLPAHAQEQTLQLFQTVNGHLSVAVQSWMVSAQQGQVLAARMDVTAGDITPQLEWVDTAGHTLLGQSSTQGKSVTVEGFNVPADGTYTLRASAVNHASGDYTLTLLPGYGTLLLNDSMDGANRWQFWKGDALTSQLESGKLRLQYTAEDRFTWTLAEQLGAIQDVYIQTEVHIERQSVYSEYGLLLRGTLQNGGLAFYVFMVNSDGKYRFALSAPDKLTVLQDWTALNSPAASDATIGVMAQNDHFTLLYNGRVINVLSDGTLSKAGSIGLVIGTGHAPASTASLLFDNFVVTVPNAAASAKLPATLRDGQRAPELIIKELQTAGIVSGAGKQVFAATQTFLRNYSGGLVLQKLAKPQQFTDVLFIVDVSWDTTQPGVACGVALRQVDDDNFTMIYIDRKGGYGVRQAKNGQSLIAYYDLSDSIKTPNLAVNRMIVTVSGDAVTLFVNGTLLTQLHGEQATGSVAIASYNYQPASARCQFDNVVVYSFDK